MSKLKRIVGIKATKATARHSVRGLTSKAQRRPLRSTTLLCAGALLGGAAVLLTRRGAAV